MTAINDGEPMWSSTDHLLADVWALLAKVHSDPDKTPDNLDHPVRAEMVAKSVVANKKKLKETFVARKRAYSERG